MKTKYTFLLVLTFWIVSIQEPSSTLAETPPIRIGATVSMEGQFKEPSFMIKKAFELWKNEINKKGGLLGRKVELILYDDKSQPQLAEELYQKLILEDRVDFVFSPYGTPLTMVASKVSEQHHYMMLACAASSDIIWERGFRYVFGIYGLAKRYFIGLLDIMARAGINDVSVIYDAKSPFNKDVVKGVNKWSQKFKITIANEKSYQDGEKELAAIVSQMKNKGVRHIIFSAYSPDCYLLLNLMKKLNYKPRILGMTIAPIHPNFIQKAGDMADRVFGPSQWEPIERIPFPGTAQFVTNFKRYADKVPSYHAGAAYAACQLYEDAIQKTESLDNEKIRDYIAALDTVTVIGRFKVDVSGKQIGHNPIIIQWQNRKKEIVWPFKMQTAPPLM